MTSPLDLVVRVAGPDDVGPVAALRSRWDPDDPGEDDFEARMAGWLESESDRRTTWLAFLGDRPVGLASLFEYRRMPRPGRPDSRWGYVSNMFVLESCRDRGVGTTLLRAIIDAAHERDYVRLVLSPSRGSIAFYLRQGFVVANEGAGDDRLLVRPLAAR